MSTVDLEEPLSAALFGKTRRRLLGWLFMHPDEAFYIRQLIRILGSSPGALPRELDELTAVGILRRSRKGREVYYQVNSESPIFEELESILRKTAGAAHEIRRALAPLGRKIELAILYGSAARGEFKSGSDIDLLVVGSAKFGDLVSALGPLQETLGREINPIVYSPMEFRRKIVGQHHFVTTVLQGPYTFVVGGEDELGRLGAQRLAGRAQNVGKRNRRTVRSR